MVIMVWIGWAGLFISSALGALIWLSTIFFVNSSYGFSRFCAVRCLVNRACEGAYARFTLIWAGPVLCLRGYVGLWKCAWRIPTSSDLKTKGQSNKVLQEAFRKIQSDKSKSDFELIPAR